MVKDPLQNYLIDPFNNLVDKFDTNPQDYLNTCHIFVGVTGQGKTYAITKNHIEKLLIEKDVKCLIYTVPLSEIREDDQFDTCVDELQKQLPSGETVKFVTKPKVALKALKQGKKVVLATTHQGIWTKSSKYGKELLKYLNLKKIKTAVFIDEAHTWTVSHFLNYEIVTGNSPSNYEARLFQEVQKLAGFTPYIFGITATPNREHTEVVTTNGTMKFSIANEMCPKDLMVWKNAWLRKVTHFNPDMKDDVEKALESYLLSMMSDEKKTGAKMSGLIQCNNSRKKGTKSLSFHADVDTVMEMVKDIVQNTVVLNKHFSSSKEVFAIMTENFCYSFSADGKSKTEYETEEELKDELNAPDSSVRVLFVVAKGKAGMNIFPLKYIMSMRKMKTKEDNLGFITENPIQLLGRAVRLYSGESGEDFKNVSPNYNMKEFISKTKISIEYIKIINSICVWAPTSKVWYEAIKQFEESYITHVDDVIFDEWNDDYEIEEEVCPYCNGTGKKFKKDIEEATNLNASSIDGINNALNTDFAGHLYVKN